MEVRKLPNKLASPVEGSRELTGIVTSAFWLAVLASCSQDMGSLGRITPFAESGFFADHSSARLPVPGTVAQGIPIGRSPVLTGIENGKPVIKIPVPITRELLKRGQERFNIYCSPCHGYTGEGDGMIVQRGFLAPPSFHQERLRNAPPGHFFNVVTHGSGAMYSYADRVEINDRWAIIAYIRALQRSRNTPFESLDPSQKEKLRTENNHGQVE